MPLKDERCAFLRKELSKLNAALTWEEIDEIGAMLGGYSIADLTILRDQASKIPKRKLEAAKFVTQTALPMMCPIKGNCSKWHPCHSKAPGAVELVDQDTLDKCLPPITFQDVLSVIPELLKSVDPYSLDKYVQFAKEKNKKIYEPYAKKKAENTNQPRLPPAQPRKKESPIADIVALL